MLTPCQKIEGAKYKDRDGSVVEPDNDASFFKREGAFAALEYDGKVLMFMPVDGEGLWELPGGGIDEGETTEQGVFRETMEETGFDLSNITLKPFYQHRVHLYLKNEPCFWNYDQNYFHSTDAGLKKYVFDGQRPSPEQGGVLEWVDVAELKTIKIKHSVVPAVAALGYL
tara:strand:- start:3849 stop:4358 length:510 start_codon:yes stop_codon:yes gene_type:complete